jgi:hypothetical protein
MSVVAILLAAASVAQAQTKYRVTIQNLGMGRGHVKSFPVGMDCTVMDGPAYSGVCAFDYNPGVVVTLVAEAGHIDVTFTGYSGAPCTGGGADCVLPALAQNYTVNVSFNPTKNYQLAVTLNGNGYGTVSQLDLRGTPKLSGCSIQGTNSTVTCSASYPVTTVARLEKTPGIQFASSGAWSGACTNDPCAITMDGARAVTATFSSPAVTVKAGGGTGSGKVTGTGGMDCTITPASESGTCFVTYPSPSQQTVTLTPQPSSGSRFSSWSVSGSPACTGSGNCVINGPAYYQPGTVVSARFDIDQRTITVSGTGSGNVKSTGSEIDCTLTLNVASGKCDIGFTPGVSVKLTATPATGWQFAGWGGGSCTGTAPTCDLVMSQDRPVVATFTRAPMTLTIAGNGTGDGTVRSTDPAGIINCAVTGTNTGSTGCSAQVPFETKVTLSATPGGNSTFESWSLPSCTGTGPCVVTMTTSQTVSATFKGTRVAVTVTGAGTGDGLVTSDGMSCQIMKGVAAAAGCLTTALPGSSASLRAVPQFGSVFGGWSVASCPAASLTCDVPVTGPATVSARFNAPPPAAQLVDALLGSAPKLSATQEGELDKFGNKDGTFNLGDLIALLDRTGESISPAALARLAELERVRPTATSPRRGVP